MSRHIFLCAEASPYYAVLMGWDRPMGQHFLVIYRSRDDDEPCYSNLYEPAPLLLADYMARLADYAIDIPAPMLAELHKDGVDNVGNKDVLHTIDTNGAYQRISPIHLGDYLD